MILVHSIDEVDGSKVIVENGSEKSGTTFLTLEAKLAFSKLRQVFSLTPILYDLDPECHICIETNVSSYAIGKILTQQTLTTT